MVKKKIEETLMRHALMFLLITCSFALQGQTVSATYSIGDIATNNSSYSPTCNGPSTPLTINLPAGGPWEITSIDIVYNMTAANGAWKSEQRSRIHCQNTLINETTFFSGSNNTGGLQSYSRSNLTIANGIYTGGTPIIFEMQAYRTWTGGGTCNTTYNKIDNNSWTIVVNYITPPTCPTPSIQSAFSITSNSASLSWTENGAASIWDLELGTVGFVPTGTPTQTGVTNSYVYSGLNSATSYDYFVRSNCGAGDYSAWIGPFNFVTTISCPAPSTLTATGITVTTADLGWTIGGVETTWDIELGLQGFSPTGTPTQSGITTNPYTYTGLVAGTAYDFYARAYCGVGDESTWVGPFNFTTNILTGQVFVSATGGTPTGIYNTMKLTFDAINAGTHTGVINITVGDAVGQTITETAMAALNKSGSGSASYTSVSIYPGAASIKITGAIGGGCCVSSAVIRLNQAENITVDGRQGGVGTTIDLIIENTTIGSYSSAFQFFAASNNILKYTTLKSAITGTCCGTGTISISDNNVGGGTGSSNNIIEYCNVTKSGSNVPRRAIVSKGANSRENNNNIIRNCNIYDFQEFGIYLGSSSSSGGYNKDCIIENNSIYQTAAQTGMFLTQAGISVGYPYSSGSSGYKEDGHNIVRNNTIGGNGSGGDWIWSTTGSYYFFGIFINDGYDAANAHSEIYGNTIKDLDITTGNTSSSSSKPIFGGIVAYNCKVKIGSSGGNTIGSLTDPNSIKLSKTGNGGYAAGISVSSNSDQSNSINNNIISGISNTTGGNTLTVFSGIYNSSSTTYPSDSIHSNNVSYLTFSKANYFNGIYGQGFIAKNRVRDIDFTGAASFSELKGISWGGGEITSGDARGIENNEVILGLNKAGASIAGNDLVTGIEIRRGDASVYYNSVLIQGTGTNSDDSYAIELPTSTFTNFNNNLMYNERTGGAGQHYAIYSPHTNSAMWGSNNNTYVIGTTANNYIGYWGGNIATLAAWQTSSGETNSISDNTAGKPSSTLFPWLSQDSLDVTDTWLTQGIVSVPSTDISNDIRVNPPTIGAYEINTLTILPIKLKNFTGTCIDNKTQLNWETVTELNNDYFTIEKSKDGVNFNIIETIEGAGTNSTLLTYQFIDNNRNHETTYYRLKQTDFDGEFTYSKLIIANCESIYSSIFPNPATNHLTFVYNDNLINTGTLELKIVDCLGKLILTKEYKIDHQMKKEIDISNLNNGLYYLFLSSKKNQQVHKFVVSK